LESPGRAGSKENSLDHFRQTVQEKMSTGQQGNELGEEGNVGFRNRDQRWKALDEPDGKSAV